MATRNSVLKEHLGAWLAAAGNKKKRGELATYISEALLIHKKSVGRSFNRIQLASKYDTDNRGRPVYYTKDTDAALFDIWEAASRPCGELLHPLIVEYIKDFVKENRWIHSDEATGKLRAMSEATVKRRVADFKKKYDDGRGLSTTRSSSFKNSIPIFKGPWEGLPPGNGQLDTVAHCGSSTAGDFVYTVNYTDSAVYWGVRRAQWNKGQEATVKSLETIKNELPFRWIMGHPDTGSEFINQTASAWFARNRIDFTRSEPNKKNDNMYVEERNGHVVRKFVGWDRLDADPEIVGLINEYYETLDPYLNHFQTVRRTLSKKKVGSKYFRQFEKKAKTPYSRLMEHPKISDDIKLKVKKEHESLSPLLLKEKLDKLKKKILDYQKTRGHRN